MQDGWTATQLERVGASTELEIAVRHADGGLGRWTPIWVVRVDGGVLVRTWFRRETGWYGAALRSRRARIRVPGLEAEVLVEPADDADSRAAVDAGYTAKYGSAGAASMTTDEAAASTLRLLVVPEPRR